MTTDELDKLIAHHEFQKTMWGQSPIAAEHCKWEADLRAMKQVFGTLRNLQEAAVGVLVLRDVPVGRDARDVTFEQLEDAANAAKGMLAKAEENKS